MYLVGFTIEICYDARPYERQMNGLSNKYCFISYIYLHMFKTFLLLYWCVWLSPSLLVNVSYNFLL